MRKPAQQLKVKEDIQQKKMPILWNIYKYMYSVKACLAYRNDPKFSDR